ncbi:MAG: helix-turn-helix domain-containing protein [Coriobacteriales bacterium]|jgi:hypothetical protein
MDSIREYLKAQGLDAELLLSDRGRLASALPEFGEVSDYIDEALIEEGVAEFVAGSASLENRGLDFEERESELESEVDTAENLQVESTLSERPHAKRALSSPASYRKSPTVTSAPGMDTLEELSVAASTSALPEIGSLEDLSKAASIAEAPEKDKLDELLESLDAGFSETLLKLIDERGMKDSDVYKRANITRQHFSKIRSNPKYQPTKKTVFALAIALELDIDQTRMLLARAGFAISHASKLDVVVEYYITNGVYDIMRINTMLFALDLPLLGA